MNTIIIATAAFIFATTIIIVIVLIKTINARIDRSFKAQQEWLLGIHLEDHTQIARASDIIYVLHQLKEIKEQQVILQTSIERQTQQVQVSDIAAVLYQLNQFKEQHTSSINLLSDTNQSMNSLFNYLNRLENKSNILVDSIERLQRLFSEQYVSYTKMLEVVRRLDAVLAGAQSRGEAGENIVDRQLKLLPAQWILRKVRFKGGLEVEFALRTDSGRLIPIDSKWVATENLNRLRQASEVNERKHLARLIREDAFNRALEVAKYIDDPRTLGFGIAVVSDVVFELSAGIQPRLIQKNIVLISHSLLLPYLLILRTLLSDVQNAKSIQTAHTIQRTTSQIDEVQQIIAEQLMRVIDSIKSQHVTYGTHNKQLQAAFDQIQNIQESLSSMQSTIPVPIPSLNIGEIGTIPELVQKQLNIIKMEMLSNNEVSDLENQN